MIYFGSEPMAANEKKVLKEVQNIERAIAAGRMKVYSKREFEKRSKSYRRAGSEKMIKLIAFDLDCTMIDFMTMKKAGTRAAAKAMIKAGLKVKEKELYRRIFETYDKKGIEYQKTFADVLWSLKSWPDLNEFERIQQAGISAYLQAKFKTLRAYPEVPSVLRRLAKKYRLAVVTDAPRNKAWQRLWLTGLWHFFPLVITYDDTRKFKPHPSPFKLLLKRTGLKPSEILFVGDNLERDVKGARRVGMRTAWARYGCPNASRRENEADIAIGKFEEVRKAVEGRA